MMGPLQGQCLHELQFPRRVAVVMVCSSSALSCAAPPQSRVDHDGRCCVRSLVLHRSNTHVNDVLPRLILVVRAVTDRCLCVPGAVSSGLLCHNPWLSDILQILWSRYMIVRHPPDPVV